MSGPQGSGGAPSSGADRPREIEAKLAIVNPEAGAVAERIAALARLAGPDGAARWTLGDGRLEEIEDVYFDAPGGLLERAGCGLRLRAIHGGAPRLALKGRAHTDAAGVVVRDELEAPWSAEALAHVLAALAEAGVALPRAADAAGGAHERLQALGLVPIQARTTHRRARHVHAGAGTGSAPVAELALDEVRYVFGGRALVHREVEVEAIPPGDVEAVRGVVAVLSAQIPGLMAWSWSKLAFGEELRRRVAAGVPRGWADPETGSLLPRAYAELTRERGAFPVAAR